MREFIKRYAVVCYLGTVVVALLVTGVVQAQPAKHVGHASQLALTNIEAVGAAPDARLDAPAPVRHGGHAAQLAAGAARSGGETTQPAQAASPLVSSAPAAHVGHAAQLTQARNPG